MKALPPKVCVAYQKNPPINTMQIMDSGRVTFPFDGEYLICRKGKLIRAKFKAGETVTGVSWVLGDACEGFAKKKKEVKCE